MLHVTNGDSTVETLARTRLGGEALAWQDALHVGPVTDVPRLQLLEARAAFLSGAGWGTTPAIFESLRFRDERFVGALAERDEVVLWFEHDLYDQLQLLDVLSLAAETGFDPQRLELIVVDAFPGRPGFRGLGELSPGELETLWPGRVTSTAELAAAARDAWVAMRAPDPRAPAAVAGAGLSGLPLVAPALRRLLEELPALRDGLSRTERQALQALVDGPRTPSELFLVTQDAEEAPFLGDAWFFRVLAELGSGPGRLLETAAGEPVRLADGNRFERSNLVLTAPGRATLSGEADRVDLLGVDRWVLGTHVTADTPWRWDADVGSVVAPA